MLQLDFFYLQLDLFSLCKKCRGAGKIWQSTPKTAQRFLGCRVMAQAKNQFIVCPTCKGKGTLP